MNRSSSFTLLVTLALLPLGLTACSSAITTGSGGPASAAVPRIESVPAPAPPGIAAPAPAQTVKVGLAWVMVEAPIELELVSAVLALQVIEGSKEPRLIKAGTWWRTQKFIIDVVPPSKTTSTLFTTTANVGSGDEPRKDPEFEVVRETRGDVVLSGRSGRGPWRELARVPFPAATKVELLDGQ